MKKIVMFALLAVAGVFVMGRVQLGQSGAMHFLSRMENLMNQGEADEVCEMFHEDLEVSISDRTARVPKEIAGGRDELCQLTHETVTAMGKVPHRMNVRWDDIEVTRSWLHPWTSEVSYTEERTMSMQGVNIRINTTSDDNITLVQTLSGVKLRKLEAETWVSE
jgi:hypothetical protein